MKMDLTNICMFVTVLVLCINERYAYPTGAPVSVCSSMVPGHGGNSQQVPQTNNIITLSSQTYDGSSPITVTIKGRIMGFMLQARKETGDEKPLGTYSALPEGTKSLTCNGAANSLTHTDKTIKTEVAVTWTPPSSDMGNIVFYLTMVQSYSTYWVKIPSSAITYQMSNTNNAGTGAGAEPPTTKNEPQPTPESESENNQAMAGVARQQGSSVSYSLTNSLGAILILKLCQVLLSKY